MVDVFLLEWTDLEVLAGQLQSAENELLVRKGHLQHLGLLLDGMIGVVMAVLLVEAEDYLVEVEG